MVNGLCEEFQVMQLQSVVLQRWLECLLGGLDFALLQTIGSCFHFALIMNFCLISYKFLFLVL